jgi:Uma2 family endonuclease
LIDDAIRAAMRTDLYVVHGVAVKISSTPRTAPIPDVVVLDQPPDGLVFPVEAVRLAVEVWLPEDTPTDRETRMQCYAAAGVAFLWTIDRTSDLPWLKLTAHRPHDELYEVENIVQSTGPTTITAAPVPITMDLASLTF